MQPGHIKTSNGRSDLEPNIRPEGFAARVSAWNRSHPILAILLVALSAVAVNCYPIIFCGKSFVSPMSTGGALVYSGWPSLPGMNPAATPVTVPSAHGSDTEAMMWWGVPVGFIESRSVLEQGTLPLWDRYGHAGATLIGQAVSMLGDPLQLIVILGHGAAGAWDIKFLTAKWLFCVGFGLLIRRLMNNQPLALIFTALAAYCGAYFFINNHPVFFVLTYAPWILVAAVEWLDVGAGRRFRWFLIWLLANFACFNAGHVEVAVVFIGGLNLAALAGALMAHRRRQDVMQILCRMGVATLVFLGLTAPVWVSFLAAMEGSYTAHAKIGVVQLPPTMLAGVFDDLFYQLFRSDDSLVALAPGTSLLVLVGCCLSWSHWRRFKGEAFFWVNSTAIVIWAGCVFRLVPAGVLAAIPLLNRVGHNYTDFSHLLVIHLTIQSAYGFKSLASVDNIKRLLLDLAGAAVIFFALLLFYSAGYSHEPIPRLYFLWAGLGAVGAPLLFAIMKLYQRPILAVGWPAVIVLGFIPNCRFGLYDFGNDKFLMLPGPRIVLNQPSPAVDGIKTDKAEPFRVAGLHWNFMGDYAAVYELEDIRSCAPVSSGEYIDLISHFPGMELTKDWKIEVLDPAQAQPLLNLLNVKYLLAAPDVALLSNMDFQVVGRGDFGVVGNPQAWPRAFFASQIVAISSNEEFIRLLSESAKQPFIALTGEEVEKQPGLQALETTPQAGFIPATRYLLLPNSTEFDIHTTAAGVVCLTEGQAKDFTATANNEPKAVLTVNRAFKGVYLDKPGDYHVKFTYRPRHWHLSVAAFWISLGGVVVMGLLGSGNKKRGRAAI